MMKKTIDKREEKRLRHERLRAHILASAIKVVGEHGYAKATMAKIAEQAGVPYGSIYLHFRGHHELLCQLLPTVSENIRSVIRDKSKNAQTFLEFETISFDVLFEQLPDKSGWQRVFAEAPFFVPEAYDEYLEYMAETYLRLMRTCKERGEFPHLEEESFEPVAYSLMGAKQFLIRKYAPFDRNSEQVPNQIRETYLNLVKSALKPGFFEETAG